MDDVQKIIFWIINIKRTYLQITGKLVHFCHIDLWEEYIKMQYSEQESDENKNVLHVQSPNDADEWRMICCRGKDPEESTRQQTSDERGRARLPVVQSWAWVLTCGVQVQHHGQRQRVCICKSRKRDQSHQYEVSSNWEDRATRRVERFGTALSNSVPFSIASAFFSTNSQHPTGDSETAGSPVDCYRTQQAAQGEEAKTQACQLS